MIKELYNMIREYWRIYLLIFVIIASIIVVFNPIIPGVDIGSTQTLDEQPSTSESFGEKYTGIQFSIELGGGTRIRAPLIGITAENIKTSSTESIDTIEENISENMNTINKSDVLIRQYDNNSIKTIEITDNVTHNELSEALDRENISYSKIRDGLTESTRKQAIRTIESRIDRSGLSGGEVRQVTLQNGNNLILVEVPNLDRQETINLIKQEGKVRVDAYYLNSSTGNYTRERGILVRDDFQSIGTPNQGQGRNQPHVPVTLEPSAAKEFTNDTIRTGVASVGGTVCRYQQTPNNTEPCLLTVVDGEVIYSAGMDSGLARDIRSGEWENRPQFILQTENYSEAQDLSINLQSGSLPAPVNINDADINFIAPQQGEDFQSIAVIIGLLSTLAVAISVSLRYQNLKITIPMVFTAFSEVIILLAIAVLLSYPIDVAVVAGFIAVIGTGVDDLIIITDRVVGGDNPARSERLFQKRFKKALWIIFSAAGTTILALGPIAVLELSQLQGFAIFTIIGVIAGVILTRPAYGEFLRYILTSDTDS